MHIWKEKRHHSAWNMHAPANFVVECVGTHSKRRRLQGSEGVCANVNNLESVPTECTDNFPSTIDTQFFMVRISQRLFSKFY